MERFEPTINKLIRQADAIIEVDANTTVLGYCAPGTTNTSQASWSICRIAKSGITTTITWANGQRNFNLILDNHNTYTYTFRKF
jgi:hypothetical protein